MKTAIKTQLNSTASIFAAGLFALMYAASGGVCATARCRKGSLCP
jgi:hypothetical protein